MCECMDRLEINLKSLPQSLFTLSLETRSLVPTEGHQVS